MKEEFSSEQFWMTMSRGAVRQLGFGILLWIVALILLSQLGCAYLQAPPHYDNLDQAVNGKPATGRLDAKDARDILALQERKKALEFEEKLAAAVIQNATAQTSPHIAEGIPGKIHNKSRYETVTFLVTGNSTKKTFTLFPGETKEFFLPAGEYTCYFLRGSNQLARPWGFNVDDKPDYLLGEWVYWGLYYREY